MWSITPGAATVAAGYTIAPRHCAGGSAAHTAPFGSTARMVRSVNGAGSPNVYHQGTPFTALTIVVFGPTNGASCGKAGSSECAFSVMTR